MTTQTTPLNNPFQPLKPHDAFLKFLLWGPPGSGKTCWALNSDRVAYISLESGADRYSHLNIEATYPSSLKDIGDVIRFLRSGNHEYQTCVIDSISVVWSLFLEEYCPEGVKPDWVMVKTKWKRFLRAMLGLRMDVIAIGRSKDSRTDSQWYKRTGDLILDSEISTGFEFDYIGFAYSELQEEWQDPLYRVRLEKVRDLTGRVKTGMVLTNTSFREFKQRANAVLEEAEVPESIQDFLKQEQQRQETMVIPEGLTPMKPELLS
ncbi:MAG: AAA family ATPase [SAR324 cluster bacterium]|nr:AAA family ATPase [SAR324 cluster bacterium]